MLPGKGSELDPAFREPARIQIESAIRCTSTLFSGIITSPSIFKNYIGSGSISIRTVQFPLTVTFSPAIGSLPSGHCDVLDQRRMKSSLTNSPAGAGHKYLQYMASMLRDWNLSVFPLEVAQTVNVLLSGSLLWVYSPKKQESA